MDLIIPVPCTIDSALNIHYETLQFIQLLIICKKHSNLWTSKPKPWKFLTEDRIDRRPLTLRYGDEGTAQCSKYPITENPSQGRNPGFLDNIYLS
jgi:hypothetical protein